MSARATINFSQPGVQPPVFVVTSASTPPWQVLEMAVSGKKTDSGDANFYRHFEGVAEGNYQYKIRIGEGHWVVDETKETTTDDVGNRNNVVRTEPIYKQTDTSSLDESAKKERRDTKLAAPADSNGNAQNQAEKEQERPETRETTVAGQKMNSPSGESQLRQDSTQLPLVPVPFVVVDKVHDLERPDYGDVTPNVLPVDASKRAADADPDYESVRPASPVETKQEIESPPVPALVVEKSDNRPSFGDDFGEDATSAQKLARELRVADAEPDKVVMKQEPHVETGTEEEQTVPLFSHESFEPEDTRRGSQPQSSMKTVEEEPIQSSTDQSSSEADILTPADSSDNKNQDDSSEGKSDELGDNRLLSHETGFPTTKSQDELSSGPLLSHETGLTTAGADNELDDGPLLSHETGFSTKSEDLSEALGELGGAPLLSHEIGFSSKSKDPSENLSELGNAPLMSHETGFSADEPTKNKGLSEPFSDLHTGSASSLSSEAGNIETKNLGELDKTPLMSHEIGLSTQTRDFGALGDEHLKIHETDFSTKSDDVGEDVGELGNVPLMPHKIGLSAKSSGLSDAISELHLAPLMAHETGPSVSDPDNASEHSRARRLSGEDEPSEGDAKEGTNRAPTSSHEEEDIPDDEYGGLDDVPLLPHERPSAVSEHSGSDVVSENGNPAFAFKAPTSPPLFARRTSSRIFKTRSNSSSLPHSLPRSDEDDEDLLDPSLEAFPTQRERILERVATIGSHLPEDEVVLTPHDTHSPDFSVTSQACSSVDLGHIGGSHVSLKRIAEEALLEAEEDEDVSALSSPVLEIASVAGAGAGAVVGPGAGAGAGPGVGPGAGASSEVSGSDDPVDGDELATPMPQKNRSEYFKEKESQQESSAIKTETGGRSKDSGAAESIQNHDGADDILPVVHQPGWFKLSDKITRPASALAPILTPPYTPEEKTLPAKTNSPPVAVAATPARPKNITIAPLPDKSAPSPAPAPDTNEHLPFYLRAWRKLFSEHDRPWMVAGGVVVVAGAWWFVRG